MKVSVFAVFVFVIFSVLCINNSVSLQPRKKAWLPGWFFKQAPKRCSHDGKYYKIGDIFDKKYDEQTNTCSASKCGLLGKIRIVIKTNCRPPPTVTSPTTSTTPPTEPPPLGCYHDGQFYGPNTEISKGQSENWCYSVYCDSNGNVIHSDDFNCGERPPPTTTPPTSRPPGCYYNGKYYPPNTEISRGRSGTWCYFKRCDRDGQILAGDDFNCLKTTPKTTLPPSVVAKKSLEVFQEELKLLLRKINGK